MNQEHRFIKNHTQLTFFIELFKKAMYAHKLIKVHMNDNVDEGTNEYFILRINDTIYEKGGCPRCCVQYNNIHLQGQIYISDDNYQTGYNYTAQLSSHDMICECDDPNYGDALLLKCHIDKPDDYLYYYYLDGSNVELTELIEKN